MSIQLTVRWPTIGLYTVRMPLVDSISEHSFDCSMAYNRTERCPNALGGFPSASIQVAVRLFISLYLFILVPELLIGSVLHC